MALSKERAAEVAAELRHTCNSLRQLLSRVDRIVALNSSLSIDWSAGELPAYLEETANGNLLGFHFSRTDVANTIGSLAQFQNLMRNGALSQGDHLGNINKITDATV